MSNYKKLGEKLFQKHFLQIIPKKIDKYLADGFSNEKLTNELNNENSEFYFALSENNIIGYLKIFSATSRTELKDEKPLKLKEFIF